MLQEFTIGNFLSFRDKNTLSLSATSIKEFADSNIISTERNQLLKSSVLYGANSSGKSNLIKAMSTMRKLVLQSFNQASTEELGIVPFLLNSEFESSPTFFEIVFIIENTKYRYGFEVDNIAFISEWLFISKKQVEKPLFVRSQEGIEVMKNFAEGKDLEDKTRDNALFLSVVDQFNGTIAKSIIEWFNSFVTISGLSHERYTDLTFSLLSHADTHEKMQAFYTNADLGFDSIKLEKEEIYDARFPIHMQAVMKEVGSKINPITIFDAITMHKKYDIKNKEVGKVEFKMDTQESAGTNKIFNMSGPIFNVLHDGGVLVIDELDASLHPLLTLAITKLFNSKEHNVKNAQLIFATHDTNLLTYGQYRRDQIYFIEKDKYGASDLYSLVEYKEDDTSKTIRNDRSFEKDYIQGRYGAIPFVGDLSKIVK